MGESRANSTNSMETIEFHVKPLSGLYTFPDYALNLKTGNMIKAEFPFIRANVDKSRLPSGIVVAALIIILIFMFPVLFAFVFIPVQIYRIIRSVINNEIFDYRNVNRIRWIGYCLLLIFVLQMFANIINTIEARALINIENYQIVFRMDTEFYTLLFALVTFMFAEILKISHTMKEEQDLTI
jgi:hypothetical protein